MLRFDAAIARFAVSQVPKSKMAHFMPWPREDIDPASPEQVLSFLKASVKKKD